MSDVPSLVVGMSLSFANVWLAVHNTLLLAQFMS